MNYILATLLTLTSFFIFGQQTKVTGKVIDSQTGEELPFVKVRFHLSKVSAMTDLDGNFEIMTASNSVLVISSIGFVTQEVNVNNRFIFYFLQR